MSGPERGRIAATEAASAAETPTAGHRDHPGDSEGVASAFRSRRLYVARVAYGWTTRDHAIPRDAVPAFAITMHKPLCGLQGGAEGRFRFRYGSDSQPLRFFAGQLAESWNPCPDCLAVMRRGDWRTQ